MSTNISIIAIYIDKISPKIMVPRYHSRVTYEGFMITLHNPDLNKKVVHKSMTFVCECANFKIENAIGT